MTNPIPEFSHLLEIRERVDTLIKKRSSESLKNVFKKLEEEVMERQHFDVLFMLN